MKVLYLSSHEVLEYDELRMLTEIESECNPGFGVDVYSMGAFQNPTQGGGFMRSVIPKGKFYPHLYQVAMQCDKDRLHPELVAWADVIIEMHNAKIPGVEAQQPWIVNNWELFERLGKRVVWRSIGQSVPSIEKELAKYRAKGLKIVRYSPLERQIPEYSGEDAMIRFYKDEDEFKGWTGEKKFVITLAQSFKRRGEHLGYALWEKVTDGFPRKVFGTENDDLGSLNGGQRTYSEMKQDLRENRVFLYFGTQPAPYTLSFMEAMMTGIPIVAFGPNLRASTNFPWSCYEIPDIITNGKNGFIADSLDELRTYIRMLMEDDELAKTISEAGRKTAIELFSKKKIYGEWSNFLKTLLT